jgi:hypothetical protein
MYHSATYLSKKTCAIVTKVDFPMVTLGSLVKFFSERDIWVLSLQMQHLNPAEAVLTICCLVERDRIRHTWYALGRISGIIEVEMLESRGGSLVRL